MSCKELIQVIRNQQVEIKSMGEHNARLRTENLNLINEARQYYKSIEELLCPKSYCPKCTMSADLEGKRKITKLLVVNSLRNEVRELKM